MSTSEPRALTAALQAPAFVTRGGAAAMHHAARHVERWAPEESASQIRPLRSLGFVDRLVSPWIESAQRSASLRMFSQYATSGAPERAASHVSWVFPRPWYQDELDWMAAARHVGMQTAMESAPAPSMLTTRGTYVAPTQASLPPVLHEYVAPSLSLARPEVAVASRDAYSPLVPFAAAQAAHVMAHAIAPIAGSEARLSPGLRAVLATMLERATHGEAVPTRTSLSAPQLVTPPAPRRDTPADEPALQVAERFAEQHAQVAELQRLARVAAERELVARSVPAQVAPSAPTTPSAPATNDGQLAEIRAAQQRAVEQRQAEIQRRLADAGARRDDASAERAAAAAAERQRLEERVAQRIAAARQQEALRLHEQSRDAAARDARTAASAPAMPDSSTEARTAEAPVARESRVAAEIAAAVAALPPELASIVTAGISARPERAVQAIAELGDALRSIELIARTTAAGGTLETTRGPRVVLPAGLGGLVATVERTAGAERMAGVERMTGVERAPRMPMLASTRVPALPFIQPRLASTPAPTSALGAASGAMPAALGHVAWSDRWLARFAGARPQSLEVLAAAASPDTRMQILAQAAPHTVFVAPMFDDRAQQGAEVTETSGGRMPEAGLRMEPLPTLRGGPAPAQPVLRLADDAETPDDLLAAIALSAGRARSAAAQAAAPQRPSLPTIDPDRYQPRDTLADLVAHAVPAAPGAGVSAQLASSPFAPALRHMLPLAAAPSFDVRALFGAGLSATYLAGLLASTTDAIAASDAPGMIARDALAFEPTYIAPEARPADEATQLEAFSEPLTTLRSTLLSFEVETAGDAQRETRVSTPAIAAQASTPLARSMVDSLALPMLGETAAAYAAFDGAHATTYAAPGMIAERAQAWSVAQERSSSDLAFDFVTPELVLAARVYGLGAAEAAQAARLAVAGPAQLSAMAGAVDRTFVQAMAIEAARRGEQTRVVTAYPMAASAQGRPFAAELGPTGEAARDSSTSDVGAREAAATAMPASSSAFGVERRAPRGAFLWPAATTAALGLNAAAHDGEQSMSIAALELLAAQAVAELGTYAALGSDVISAGVIGAAGTGTSSATTSTAEIGAEASADEVLAQASALVPAARRDKFHALYVALGQSARTASPAARAARALALAGRGDETISARERAAIAWDVLPVVHGLDARDEDPPLSTGDAAARATRRREELRAFDPMFVDARPGLAGLSARAGEALGSYVTPQASSSAASSSSSSREAGAVLRAPTAAQELVQTGRPASRTGGGEVEIPAWFEQAARKMFESKSSISDGISIAELTLVNAAPAAQVAAATRVSGGQAPTAVQPAAAPAGGGEQVDIEKLANDVYREVLVLMDLARARNGEPYL